MRDLIRRIVAWLFPPHDPDALAALDGGPGPEPKPWPANVIWVDELRPMTQADLEELRAYWGSDAATG